MVGVGPFCKTVENGGMEELPKWAHVCMVVATDRDVTYKESRASHPLTPSLYFVLRSASPYSTVRAVLFVHARLRSIFEANDGIKVYRGVPPDFQTHPHSSSHEFTKYQNFKHPQYNSLWSVTGTTMSWNVAYYPTLPTPSLHCLQNHAPPPPI